MKSISIRVALAALVLTLAQPKPSFAQYASWDETTRRAQLADDTWTPWLINAFARIQLTDGTTINTSDERFDVVAIGLGRQVAMKLSDKQGVLELWWTLKMLDNRSATAQLEVRNCGEKTLRLSRLDVLVGRVVEKADPEKRHVLLNGFVLSPPHPTTRKEGVTSLTSHETIAIESPPLAAGWLTGKHNFGHVDLKNLDEQPVVFAWGECDDCELAPGAARTSDLFFLSTHDHPLAEMERFASLAAEINEAKIWPPRIAWCTWYAGWQRKQMAAYRDGMERGIEQMIPEVKRQFASRGATTMRICDDFIDYGDWSNKTKTIPGGFDRLAGLIDEAGLTPGVWYAPYWAEAESKVLQEHPEWFARDKDGEIWYETGWQPKSRDTTKFAVFDTTHPDVVDYFAQTARNWRERGFQYVSTDFLNWAYEPDRFHDATKTKAEVLHAGMAAIRRGLGPDIFYRPINNPLGVAMGIGNDTRISGDSHGDNPTAYYRTGEVWFYNRRLWLNDPSAIVCARYGELRDLQWNRMWMSWMALAGTVLTYGEVIDELPEKYVRMYQRIFPNVPVAGRPLDIWENDPYMLWGMAPGEADGPYELFGVFDLKGEAPGQVALNLDVIRARCHRWDQEPESVPGEYLLWDFWNEMLLRSDGATLVIEKPQRDCRVFALRANLGRPQLLGTSGHFSCGVVETRDVKWDANEKTLCGEVRGNGGDGTTLYFHLPSGVEVQGLTVGGRTMLPRQHAPNVIAVDIPPAEHFSRFRIVVGGDAQPVATRAFQTGKAVE
jgi:melibiase-like protein